MRMLLCLKGLQENHSYKYFLLKRLSVNYRSTRVQGLCKRGSLIGNIQHPVYCVAAGSLFVMFLQVFTEVKMCNPFDWAVSVRYFLKLYACGVSIYCAEKFRIDPLLASQSETILLQWLCLGNTYQCQSLCNRGCWQ